ncbi:MAG: hypothetical protein J5586_06985 [Clostridia bacterium]|nr:hypothetical protein [Clostridia bacterium]
MENETAKEKRTGRGTEFIEKVKSLIPLKSGRYASFGERKPWYKLPLARRIFYLVLSVLLAMFLWGYVLMTKNPDRTKTFTGVALSFESGAEADLLARKLTVYGDISKILDTVNVTVSAPLTEISKIKENNITATVNLNDVHSAGTYTLEIKATSTIGTVVGIDPSTIELTVDDIVSRTVPVTFDYTGELPEGYWHDMPTMLTTATTLEGAKTDLMNVSNAIFYIDLTNVTESINRSFPLSVIDKDGNEMDPSVFKNIIPAVSVQMNVLPHRHVPIVYDIADEDQLTDLLEVTGAGLNFESIDIAADPQVLASIESITSDPVHISGITEAGSYAFPLTLYGIPDDAVILGGVNPSTVQLTVIIGDRQVEQKLSDVPILFSGEDAALSYRYGFTTVDVVISGPARIVRDFLSSELIITVNVGGRGTGEYDLPLEYRFIDNELYAELDVRIAEPTVHVEIVWPPATE